MIIRNNVASSILSAFAGIFRADNVQNGLSLLKGKVGKQIASKVVNIIDDPLLYNGFATKHFDAEGVLTYSKKLLENGMLMNYLYNTKTAIKDGLKTTGNASRSKFSVGVSPSNFYIVPGLISREELISKLDNGLLVTECEIKSGTNSKTGDFSLSAKGFRIVNGKVLHPVNRVVISGNFYKLLEDVVEIDNDLKFGIPNGGYFGSPSLLVKELSLAGK